ncbi:hypothetical protein ACM26W_05920 [Halomonas sp. HK25]|uniref:hypothetical protein n=1 Tax=Halomonas sp. HK25 TaxID=3394321 RepID=UPI0039FCC541
MKPFSILLIRLLWCFAGRPADRLYGGGGAEAKIMYGSRFERFMMVGIGDGQGSES